jgi:hypothetical protein
LTLRRWAVVADWPSALYLAALAVGFALPFEAISPMASTPWFGLTDDKLMLVLLVAGWLIAGFGLSRGVGAGQSRWCQLVPTRAEWRVLLPTFVFIAATLVSARFAAADYADEAVRFVARLLAAAFVMLVALRLGRDPRQVIGLLWAVALGAGLSALLGIGEALHATLLGPVLALFKVAPTRVGGELRVSASFQYATIAAMYFEMVTPLAIVLAATARRGWTRALGLAIAIVCTANVVLSLTRAGMLALAAVFAVLIVVGCARDSLRRVLLPALAGAAVLVGGAILLLVRDPVFDLRLQTESDADWYGAAYSAPAVLNLEAGHTSTVDIDVRNEGRITWTSSGVHPFALGYRWLTETGDGVLDLPAEEVPLGHDVEPGQNIHLQANVVAPSLPPGRYRLDWGMLQRDVLQFYERGWADAETRVLIAPGAQQPAMPGVRSRDDDEAPWVVGRLDLWGAAGRMIAAHPLFGVGPDNFRHYYGSELGLEAWDERIQANNLYLEVLADLGVLGLAAFAWVVGEPLVRLGRRAWLGTRQADSWEPGWLSTPMGWGYVAIGIGLAVGAFLVHGLLDSFLAFNATAWLLWLLLGAGSAWGARVRAS